ncbi:unnamed protein product [Chrysodeixis includens]|uniref:Uncharacterized protein n=1 Tax=Chrysodeixis includens TaxID=689277 RepID=A0A9P0BQ68_CHRIL|nr:unnamed protein product [Chrysodeixis includens]
MVDYIKCSFVLLFAISAVLCENCVTYDFGGNFYSSFNHGNSMCEGMASWSLGNYSSIHVPSPHQDTDQFITPSDVLSCMTSYSFEMKSSGTLEVNVYMESTTQRDQVVVLVNEFSTSSKNVVTGTAIVTPLSNNYVNGWQIVKIKLFGTEVFNGYITFLGVASPGSTVIIDSFRYIPPKYDDDCHIYDGALVTQNPTTPEPLPTKDCLSYDFESRYDELFKSERGFCTSFTKWNLGSYSSSPIDAPSAFSQQFISPNADISCVSSVAFDAVSDGIVEVNVYMESAADFDQVTVLVNKIEDENHDVVTGSTLLTPTRDDYVDGWHTLKISLLGHGSYKGYISFLGLASEDSVVIIDSFRYIPPSSSSEKCKIYEDDFATTTPVPETTLAPIGSGQECITYNFESDFETTFDTSNVLCNGYSSWHLGNYYSLGIGSIDDDSKTFISPNTTSSCISSFVFRMIPGGTVEVNVFMESVSDLDYVIVLAKKRVPDGVDTVAGFQLYYATNSNFVKGWNVLKVSITDFTIFNGYITLIGSTDESSIVLIDSFRYIPPNSTEDCEIY